MKLSKRDKKEIKKLLKIAENKPECKETCDRSISHILDRVKNPFGYRGIK